MAPLIVLITGANQGIGYSAAIHLAQKEGTISYITYVGARSVEKATSAVAKILKENPSISSDKLRPLLIDIDSHRLPI